MNVVSPDIGTDADGQGLMFKNVSRLYLTSSELTPADGLLKRQMVCYKMLKMFFPVICFYYVATGRTPQIGTHVRLVKTGQEIATG